ncbi:MAG: DMT family transporter [Pseudomonadota bacterium]
MNSATLFTIAVVTIGGFLLAMQGPINASLGRTLSDPVAAAMISFGVGFIFLIGLTAARQGLPSGDVLTQVPWWAWTGGFIGAYYVFAILWAAPRVGVLTVASATVLGQLTAGLILDSVGAFGIPVQAITWQRIAGVGMVLGGLLLSRA